MAPDPLDALRLSLMQDVLPVSLAALERVRRGGPQELIEAFGGGEGDPLERLRQEGEPAASRVREQLDQVSPGLGNPVMKVEVRDVPADPAQATTADATQLQARLCTIQQRLRLLEERTFQAEELP